MALCGTLIDTAGPIAFGCDLDTGHNGPHRAAENARSIRERDAWEKDNGVSTVPSDEFGPLVARPQTTAERYTLNPTPHPKLVAEAEAAAAVQPEPVTEPAERPLIIDQPVGSCQFCTAGDHQQCLHRADLINVIYNDYKGEINYCGCLQDNPKAHGLKMSEKSEEPAPKTGVGANSSGVPDSRVGNPGPDANPGPDSIPGPAATAPEPDPEVVPEPVALPSQPPMPPMPPMASEEAEDEEVEDAQVLSIQDRIVEKMREAVDKGQMGEDDFEGMKAVIESSKKKRGTTGELTSSFNGKDMLELAINRTRDQLVYLVSLLEARDASHDVMVEAVREAIIAARQGDTKLSVDDVADIAVSTIFKAAGGPVASQ